MTVDRARHSVFAEMNDVAARYPHPWRGPPPALPLIVGAVEIVVTFFASHGQPERHAFDAIGILLLGAGAASLALRGRWPRAVLWFTLATTLTYYLLDYPRGPIFFALIVALFAAITSGHRVTAAASLIVGYFSFLWLPYLVGVERSPSVVGAVALAAWLLVLFGIAELARTRRERALEAIRMRAEEARRRASEERLTIARELHDVLAHNISLINVQAGVALHLMDEKPEQARTALTAIKQASNEALGELRSVLDILRREEDVPREPTAGLAQLDDVVKKARAAGLNVRTEIEGKPLVLPAPVDFAAFRIVQEALTNITRHAGDAHATVRVMYGSSDLVVQIDDDGRGGGAISGGGNGIPGMRERATALGGRLEAGPRVGGGFRVRATLPLTRPNVKERG
jgi:signal transduction histidine kinase